MKGRIIRNENPTRLALPRVGLIKTGYKDEKGLPRSLDYFVASGKYAKLFSLAYGEKPKTIQILFPEDDPSKVCSERYEYRDDEGRLFASGDGEEFEVWDGKKYQKLKLSEYPKLKEQVKLKCPNRKTKDGGDGWEVVLTLNFIIPLVRGVAGVWQYTTKGELSTIPQIRDIFDAMFESRGFVRGIIFDLSVEFAKSQKPGVKSRYPVVSLVPNQSEENVLKVKQAYQKILGNGENFEA